jgi:short-subunit dehydrogenase
MTTLKGKNVLVLGGSGALGSALTVALASQGATVMATSSSIESAERIPHQGNPRLLLDLTNSDSISVFVEYLLDSGVAIDGIVNATGVVAFGNFQDLESSTLEKLFQVNALGPIRLFHGLLPKLRESNLAGNEPFIVNLSGVVAESPMAGLAAYSASKSAIHSFNQALSRELRREGIKVLDARPGHTETGLSGRAIQGTAPAFPQGMATEHVVSRIIRAILEDEKDLPSSSFQ